MQNAEAAKRKSHPGKDFIDWSSGMCANYQGKSVKAFTVCIPDYRLPEEASRGGAGPLLVAIGLATCANAMVIEVLLRKMRQLLYIRYGKARVSYFDTLPVISFHTVHIKLRNTAYLAKYGSKHVQLPQQGIYQLGLSCHM